MSNLFTREEEIKSSSIYIGYLILKELKKKEEEKITIFEVSEKLKRKMGVIHYRQIVFALIFLYMSGLINFSEPYIYKT